MSASGESLYTFRTAYPDVLQVDRDQRVTCPVYRDAALVVPTAGTYSFLAPDGTAIVDEDPIDEQGGVAGFDMLAAHVASATYPKGEGYQQVWALTLDGVEQTIDREAALALRPLYPVITDQDLLDEFPTIGQHRGTATTSFQPWIDSAWKRIVGRLCAEGQITYSVKSAWAFRTAELELTAGLFWRHRGAQAQGGAEFRAMAETHMKAYEAAWGSMSWTSDADHDGRVDDPARRTSGGSGIVHINQAPKGYRRLSSRRW